MGNNLFDDKDIVERMMNKIDEISKEIVQLKLISIKQENNLKEHMRRSDALEAHIDIVRTEIQPIKKHVGYVEAGLKLIGFLSIIAGIVQALLEIKKLLP